VSIATGDSILDAERAGVDLFSGVIGQSDAVAQVRAASRAPVHAYLLVGPHGSGKRALARAFAAALLSEGRSGDDAVRHASLALAEAHPDLNVVERKGASISTEQADDIVSATARASVEGGRRVLVLDEFHLVRDAAPKLLKSIEEPPSGTVFLVLADEVPPELVTIASRCVRIDLASVPAEAIAEALIVEGIDVELAGQVATAAAGDLRRARLLATDPRLALRRAAWWNVPDHLDGTGAAAVEQVDSLLAMIDDAMAPLAAVHAAEADELAAIIKERGERGSGRKLLEDRHKREVRRHRSDEIRFGLAELSRRLRDDMLAAPDPRRPIEGIAAVSAMAGEWVRNPNERLQLIGLFLKLGRS
jgi:DNA polymerase-3 subunit delta'